MLEWAEAQDADVIIEAQVVEASLNRLTSKQVMAFLFAGVDVYIVYILAAQRIRGAILDAVRAADWAPRSVRMLARKLENVEQKLATGLGRVPTPDEIAEALDMTRAELSRLQDRMFRSVVLALEHEVGDMAEEELTLVDVLTDHRSVEPLQELENRELHGYLRDAISLLPERHRLVVIGYFLEGRTSQ